MTYYPIGESVYVYMDAQAVWVPGTVVSSPQDWSTHHLVRLPVIDNEGQRYDIQVRVDATRMRTHEEHVRHLLCQ